MRIREITRLGMATCVAASIASIGIVGATTVSASTEPEPAAERQSVRFMQLGESLTWSPFLVARGTDCYGDNGLDVEWINGPANGQQAALAVDGGDADIVGVGTSGFLSSVAARRPLVAFAAGAKGDTSSIVLSNEVIDELAADGVTLDSPVADRMAALTGLTIGANTAGGPVYLSAVDALAEFGLSESEVHLQALDGPAAMVAAMKAGQLDGFVYSPPAVLQPVVEGEGQIWIDGPRGDVEIWKEGYFWLYVTRSDYAEEHPDVLQTVFDCVVESSQMIVDDPEGAAAAMREFFPSLDDESFERSFEALSPVFVDGPGATEEGYQQSVDRYNASADAAVDLPFSDAFLDLSGS